jgi:hypothetical protein
VSPQLAPDAAVRTPPLAAVRRSLARRRALHIAYKLGRMLPQASPWQWLHAPRSVAVARVLPETMLSPRRLFNAWDLVRAVERDGVPGAIVECGVWSGGSVGLMALASARYGDGTRPVHLFDSFEGLPQPSRHDEEVLEDFRRDHGAMALDEGSDGSGLHAIGACRGAGAAEVRRFLERRLGIPAARLHVWEGWFQDTVPGAAAAIGPIAVLRLDGDWYESTRTCLEGLWDAVVPGGYVIIDDYGTFTGCRRAVDEFLAARGVAPRLIPIDGDGCYLRR